MVPVQSRFCLGPILACDAANLYLERTAAQVAELADALGSGPSGSNLVQVRFLSWAIGYAETSYVT